MDNVQYFNKLECSTNVIVTIQSTIRSALELKKQAAFFPHNPSICVVEKAVSIDEKNAITDENVNCATINTLFSIYPVIKKILQYLSLKDMWMFGKTCQNAQICVENFLAVECALQISFYQDNNVNPIIPYINDAHNFRHGCLCNDILYEINKRFFANMGLLLFKKLVPTVIEKHLGVEQSNLFIQNVRHDVYAISCIKERKPLPEFCEEECAKRNCMYFVTTVDQDAQCVNISMIGFSIVKEKDQFIVENKKCSKWLDQRKKQLKMSSSASYDMIAEDLQLQPQPSLNKNMWMQAYCLSTHWAETLFLEEIARDCYCCRITKLEDDVFHCLMFQCDYFRSCLASVRGKKELSKKEKNHLKQLTMQYTEKILMQKNNNKLTPIQKKRLDTLSAWINKFRNKALSYFNEKGHIIFCYRITQEGISYNNRRIARCLKKSLFAYHLAKTLDEVEQFLDEYSNNIHDRDCYLSFEVFFLPKEACKEFLSEEMIRDKQVVCIFICSHIVEKFFNYHQYCLAMLIEESLRPMNNTADHYFLEGFSRHCYDRDVYNI